MSRYVVRPRLGTQASMEGRVGASSITVRADTEHEAKLIASAEMGLRPDQLETEVFDVGVDDTLTVNLPPDVMKRALEQRGDQDTHVV